MNNPPAFPNDMSFDDEYSHLRGMTLRDYFAAKSLNALITEGLRLDHESWDATAQHAYIIADAMLKYRNK